MDTSLKSIADEIVLILTKFRPTDEMRVPYSALYKFIHYGREELIQLMYDKEGTVDPNWLQDLGLVPFHRVNFADKISLTSCKCDISKAILPAFITIGKGHGNQDLGVNVMSACGKTKYHLLPLANWKELPDPSESEMGMFSYYARLNNVMYVNRLADNLRIYGVLQNPEEAVLINSEPITSGSLVNGTTYIVKYGDIVYDGVVRLRDTTFTAGAVATFTGQGKVYKNSQVASYRDTDPYPVGGDMARKIIQDILVKEFGLERQQVADTQNDSRDDATKIKV